MEIENQDLVENTENTEQTVEEIVEDTDNQQVEDVKEVVEEPVEEKKYTDKDLDEIIKNKLSRKENKIRRDLEKKYSKLESVLNQGLGTTSVEEATNKLYDFYTQKGISVNTEPKLNDKQVEILANAEAQEIIDLGYDDIVEEVDRLTNIGYENMSNSDKIIFRKLANERKSIEDTKDLRSIGITKLDDEFNNFAKNLSDKLSTKEKYELYMKYNPKPKKETIGSMKSTVPNNSVKDYYTPDEVDKLTKKDLQDPKVMEAVENSMAKW